jgi:6-phosphogluconolactonase
MTEETFQSDQERNEALVAAWQECGGRSLQQRGSFSVALSAQPASLLCLRQLSRVDWPWSATHLYLADENWVPRHHPSSHHRQIFEACRPHPVQLHGWETENMEPDLSARRFEKHLIQELGKPPQFDLAILESGTKGQVAGLYPHSPAMQDDHLVALDQDVPGSQLHQLTLTLKTYLRAREIWLITEQADFKYRKEDPQSPAGRLIHEARALKIFMV